MNPLQSPLQSQTWHPSARGSKVTGATTPTPFSRVWSGHNAKEQDAKIREIVARERAKQDQR
jgi:hypothetical protein